MKTMYKITSIFTIKPSRDSSIILEEFENEPVFSNDEHDHNGWYGEGHRKAMEYVNEHGGVIIRKTEVEYVEYFISEDNGKFYEKL